MTLVALKSLFRDEQQFRVFMVMCLSTLFNFILVIYRSIHINFDWGAIDSVQDLKYYRGTEATFFFLLWNLFLAWIPYWVALILDFYTRLRLTTSALPDGEQVSDFLASIYSSSSRLNLSTLLLLAVWLLFFPNAPYLITDFLHLKDAQVVPHWYDVMLFISFAWTGMMLGYCSLFEVQHYLEQVFKAPFVWFLVTLVICMGGFGVYMGRFQRWNSWDILSDPFTLIKQQVQVLTNPLAYWDTLGVAVVLSGFMMIGYLTLSAFRVKSSD